MSTVEQTCLDSQGQMLKKGAKVVLGNTSAAAIRTIDSIDGNTVRLVGMELPTLGVCVKRVHPT